MKINLNQHDTWSCWLWEIMIDFPQTLSLGYSFPSDFVTWSSWVWLIIIDFPQTLSSHNQVTKSEGNQ
jgi:hypothetical protein